MQRKIDYFSYILFMIVGASSLITSNTIMRLQSSYGFLIYLIIFPFIILLSLLVKPCKNSIKIILNSKLIKIISILFFLSTSLLTIIAYAKVTNAYFYKLTSPTIFLILLLLASLFLSTLNINHIIKIAMVFFSVMILLKIFSLCSNINFDLNIIDSKIEDNLDFFRIVGFIFCYLDLLIIPFFVPSVKVNNKFNIFTLSIATLINTFLILENYLLYDFNFFVNAKFPYLYKFLTYQNNNFFEHLDTIYLIFISSYFVFKLATNLYCLRLCFKIKNKSYFNFLIPFFLLFLVYLVDYVKFNISIIYYSMLATIAISLLFLLFINIKKRDVSHE